MPAFNRNRSPRTPKSRSWRPGPRPRRSGSLHPAPGRNKLAALVDQGLDPSGVGQDPLDQTTRGRPELVVGDVRTRRSSIAGPLVSRWPAARSRTTRNGPPCYKPAVRSASPDWGRKTRAVPPWPVPAPVGIKGFTAPVRGDDRCLMRHKVYSTMFLVRERGLLVGASGKPSASAAGQSR